MNPITDVVRYFAVFYDDEGRQVGKKRISFKTKNFKFIERGFIFNPNKQSFFKINYPTHISKFFYWNINNPEGMNFKKKQDPFMSSSDYDVAIDSSVIKELDNSFTKKNWIVELISNPIVLIIGFLAIAVIWWIQSNGGKLW